MDASQIATLLAAEYNHLTAIYESYQTQSLGLKEWSVTISLTALIGVYTFRKSENPGRVTVFIAAIAAVPFYIMDAIWKALQNGYLHRLREIEAHFRELDPVPTEPLQSVATWQAQVGDHIGFWAVFVELTNTTVFLPHLPVILGGLALAIWFPPKNGTR